MRLDFEERLSPSSWDGELLEHDFPHVFQSSAFGELYPQLTGSGEYQPRYLYIGTAGRVIGQCLFAVSKRQTAQWMGGPVVHSAYLDSYDMVVTRMIEYLGRRGVAAIDFASTRILYSGAASKDDSLYSYPAETSFVDLTPSVEETLKACDSSVRKNVRKCRDAGVSIDFSSDPAAAPAYIAMLSGFRRRLGFPLPPLHPSASSLSLFNRAHTSMEIATASVQGTPLAAMGYARFGSLVTEIAAAESEEYSRLKLPVNDLIKIAAIERFKSQGLKCYDITGGRKFPKSAKALGIQRFKRKFGKATASYHCIEERYLNTTSVRQGLRVLSLRSARTIKRLADWRPTAGD